MEQNKDFLVKEPIGKLLFRLAIPTVIAQMINMLYNIVDRIYIGHIPEVGALALTGVGVCMPLIMILSAFAALVGNGGAPRASILLGKGDSRSAEKIIGNCFTLQILISIVLTVIMLLGGKTFLLAFGASENTIEYAVSYFNIYAIGTIFVQLTLGMNMFITAQGFTKWDVLRSDRSRDQYHAGSDIYFCLWPRRPRSGACNDPFAGVFVYLGASFSFWKKDDTPY